MKWTVLFMLMPSLSFGSGIFNPGSGSGGGTSGPVSLSTGVIGAVDISTQTNLTASGAAVLSGDNVGVGTIDISTGTNLTASGAAVLAGDNISVGLISLSTGVTGTLAGAPINIVNTTSTITSTMTVIVASAPAGGAWITLTMPDALTNTGFAPIIYKGNTSTSAIKIAAAGSDLIEGSGTVRLDAFTQHASLLSLGVTGWGAGPAGIQYTPPFLGWLDGRDANTVGTSSNVLVCPVYTPVPVTVVGYRFYNTAGAANVSFGMYDQYGNLAVGTSTGPVSDGGFGAHTVLSFPTTLPGGSYWVAFQASNLTAQYGGVSANGSNGSLLCSLKASSVGGVPTTYGFPGTATFRIFTIKVLLAGGRTTE